MLGDANCPHAELFVYLHERGANGEHTTPWVSSMAVASHVSIPDNSDDGFANFQCGSCAGDIGRLDPTNLVIASGVIAPAAMSGENSFATRNNVGHCSCVEQENLQKWLVRITNQHTAQCIDKMIQHI